MFHYLYIHRKKYGYAIGGVIIVLLLAAFVVKLYPNRFEKNVNSITEFEVKKMLGQRSEIWSISYELALKHKMLGIGTGYQIEAFLSEAEMEVINKDRLFMNAHNQFLQTFLDHGILGLCVLLFLIIYSFYFAVKTQNYLLLMLQITLFVNIIFESMFERSHGIITFVLFYCFFLAKNNIFATVNSKSIENL
jgi:O-antigen ligase